MTQQLDNTCTTCKHKKPATVATAYPYHCKLLDRSVSDSNTCADYVASKCVSKVVLTTGIKATSTTKEIANKLFIPTLQNNSTVVHPRNEVKVHSKRSVLRNGKRKQRIHGY